MPRELRLVPKDPTSDPAGKPALSVVSRMASMGDPDPSLERELVKRAASGDERAFRDLVRLHESTVAAVVTGMLGPGDDADDVGQETFIRLLRSLPNFRGDAALKTFLVRIAMNASLDMIAKRKRATRIISIDEPHQAFAESIVDVHELSDNESERTERVRLVQQAVDQLDGKHRAVVVLRLLEERSTNEAASILGVPPGTIMSRLTRALHKLETILRPVIDR